MKEFDIDASWAMRMKKETTLIPVKQDSKSAQKDAQLQIYQLPLQKTMDIQ